MELNKCPYFDVFEEDSIFMLTKPLCDILHTLENPNFCNCLNIALFPIEICETILHYLEHDRGVDSKRIKEFYDKYITVDSLYRVDKLIELWGREKYDTMIADMYKLTE
jgi:hypothetical protein